MRPTEAKHDDREKEAEVLQGEVVYLQFTNPAGYPPLLHSSRILADRGWKVTFLGVTGGGSASLELEPHPNSHCHYLPLPESRLGSKVIFVIYLFWVLSYVGIKRPAWLYVSDPFACVAGYWASRLFGIKAIYHEHDSLTDTRGGGWFMRFVMKYRLKLARNVTACVLPQLERLTRFAAEAGRPEGPFCVWNCPSRKEAEVPRPERSDSEFRLAYAGSLSPERLPFSLINALSELPESVVLHVIGYETVGSRGFVNRFMAEAQSLGVGERVSFLGSKSRHDMLPLLRQCDLGLALMPMHSSDINMEHMAGASNKPFDFMACGLALLVSELRQWKEMFVDDGFGLACDPQDSESIRRAIEVLLNEPDMRKSIGERGRRKVIEEWNYEMQFAPVMELIKQ